MSGRFHVFYFLKVLCISKYKEKKNLSGKPDHMLQGGEMAFKSPLSRSGDHIGSIGFTANKALVYFQVAVFFQCTEV
jgi:hypothetical protein